MKKILLLLLALMMCISLCSCDSLLKKAKSMVTGEAESEMPRDYIATLENETFAYELYDEYVKLIEYIAPESENTVVDIPTEIDGRPVTVIGSLCFYETANKVTQVNISSSVTTIDENAFYYVEGITAITIPDNVKKIGSRAFAWCNNLETVTLGAGITMIPEFCFNHCSALKTINVPESVTKISTRAFSYCDSLTEFVVPQNVKEIGDRVFDSCTNLEYLYFEGSDTVIGSNLFENSEKTVVISADGSTAKAYCEQNGLRWSTSKDVEAIVPGESSEVENTSN